MGDDFWCSIAEAGGACGYCLCKWGLSYIFYPTSSICHVQTVCSETFWSSRTIYPCSGGSRLRIVDCGLRIGKRGRGLVQFSVRQLSFRSNVQAENLDLTPSGILLPTAYFLPSALVARSSSLLPHFTKIRNIHNFCFWPPAVGRCFPTIWVYSWMSRRCVGCGWRLRLVIMPADQSTRRLMAPIQHDSHSIYWRRPVGKD